MGVLLAALGLVRELLGALKAYLELRRFRKEVSDRRRPRHLRK